MNFDANMRAAASVRALADRMGATPGQVALAWLLHRGDIAPIPGTKRRAFLEENVGALDLALSAADMAELEAALSGGKASGERYAPHLARFIDR